MIRANTRATRGPQAARVNGVFYRHRQTVNQPKVFPGHHGGFGGPCSINYIVGDRNYGIQSWIDLVDSLQKVFDNFDRRNRPRPD